MTKLTLNGDDIFDLLNVDYRAWGNQPSIYLMVAILEQLPLSWLEVGVEIIHFETVRELTALEYFSLMILKPDSIEQAGTDNIFRLWWD